VGGRQIKLYNSRLSLNFRFVVVEGGKELMPIATDADRVVTATFQR